MYYTLLLFVLQVEHLLEIERKISSVPSKLSAGSVVLCPTPVRDALQGLAAAWKTQYALVIIDENCLLYLVAF